jgi:hypothetical protein
MLLSSSGPNLMIAPACHDIEKENIFGAGGGLAKFMRNGQITPS